MASNNFIQHYLYPHLDKQIILINRIGDENCVKLEAIGEHSCTVRFEWGTRIEVHYQDDDYDFKV